MKEGNVFVSAWSVLGWVSSRDYKLLYTYVQSLVGMLWIY